MLTGNLRARLGLFGGLVLQVEEHKGKKIYWRDATPEEVNPTSLMVNLEQIASPNPLTKEEIDAFRVTQRAAEAREKAIFQQAANHNSTQIILKLRKELIRQVNQGTKNIHIQYEPCTPFDIKLIQRAFPNCHVFGNGNEGGSGDFSIDLVLDL